MFGKKAMSFAVAGALAMGSMGLVACGGNNNASSQAASSSSATQDFATAAEFFEAAEKAEGADNYKAAINMNLDMDVMGQAVSTITTMDLQVAGDSASGTGSAQAADTKTEYQMYIEKEGDQYATYTGSEDGGETSWTKTLADTALVGNSSLTKEMLNDAKIEKSGDEYKITIPGKSMMETLAKSGNNMMSSLENVPGADQLTEAFNKADAVYTYGSDLRLKDMSYAVDANMDLSSLAEGQEMPEGVNASDLKITFKIDLKMTASDYGSVDASKVKVPEDVKANAIELDGLTTESGASAGTTTETTTTETTDANGTTTTETTTTETATSEAASSSSAA